MQVTFLGTSCMMPTRERNTPAVFLRYQSEGILFDCGEGTQRQMKIAGIPIPKVTKIFISHWHGDHVFGLPGLLQTYAAGQTGKTLHIYGPKGSKKAFNALLGGYFFESDLKIKLTEVHKGVFFENEDFKLESAPMKHTTACVALAFIEKDKRRIRLDVTKKLGIPEGPLLGQLQKGKKIVWKGKEVTPEKTTRIEKGRKIAFITDTIMTENCINIAKNADLLICDSTFGSKLKEKAEEYGHLTALEAGLIASKAGVKKLVLTHFSARYKDTLELEEEARTVFDNAISAKDFMKINL